MCDNEATTQEHVPPRCLFPKESDLSNGRNLRCDLITVPSCDEHNSKKSGDDEYLMYTLVMNLPANEIAQHQFSTKIQRAIERNPSLISRIVSDTIPIRYEDMETRESYHSIAVNADKRRLDGSFDHICRALYFHETGSQLKRPIRTLCNFLVSLDSKTAEEDNERVADLLRRGEDLLLEEPEKGTNDPVFSYKLTKPPGTDRVLILLRFYGGLKVLGMTLDPS